MQRTSTLRGVSLLGLLLVLQPALTGCAEDREPAAAGDVVASFQHALLRRDESKCRSLLTNESAASLADMPWDRVAKQRPLEIRGTRRDGNEFRVDVVDPNRGGAAGEFVVVREYGKLVVDLVASAALTATVVATKGGEPGFEPRELTPADLDRIRLHELAQPPR